MIAFVVKDVNYLDEDVSNSRLSVAWVPLAGHDANGLAIDLVVVEIFQALDSCAAAAASEAKPWPECR